MISPELRKSIENVENALLDLAPQLDNETAELLQKEGLVLGDPQDANFPMWQIKIVMPHWKDVLV